jgi:hypothetical protein
MAGFAHLGLKYRPAYRIIQTIRNKQIHEVSHMARIRWVEESEATGDAAAAYSEFLAANPGRPGIPAILKCMSLRPDFFRDVVTMSDRVHFSPGHLTVRIKEMIATLVSALNLCPY